MKKPAHQYLPRPGSKVAEAIEALSNGPMTPRELAQVLQRDSSAINTLLLRALTHQAIIKVKDKRGRLYFAIPNATLHEQFTPAHAGTSTPINADTPSKQNILQLIASTGKTPSLISSNVRSIHGPEHSESLISNEQTSPESPSPSIDANSAPVIAGLFSDGELTISIGGECLQLDTSQRQQLYAYLHKIRYLE